MEYIPSLYKALIQSWWQAHMHKDGEGKVSGTETHSTLTSVSKMAANSRAHQMQQKHMGLCAL